MAAALGRALLGAYRRVPTEEGKKTQCLFRPVAVHSVILRLLEHQSNGAHPSQHATMGGIFVAAFKLGARTEASLHRSQPTWAVTIDFPKLFHTSDPTLAGVLLGLFQESIAQILQPRTSARGPWQVPRNAPAKTRKQERGIPKGLATLVVLSS